MSRKGGDKPLLNSPFHLTYPYRDNGDVDGTETLRAELRARRELPPPAMRKAIREAAGVTRTKVARSVGVTRQAVALWESGRRTPSGRYLEAYLRVLRLLREEAGA